MDIFDRINDFDKILDLDRRSTERKILLNEKRNLTLQPLQPALLKKGKRKKPRTVWLPAEEDNAPPPPSPVTIQLSQTPISSPSEPSLSPSRSQTSSHTSKNSASNNQAPRRRRSARLAGKIAYSEVPQDPATTTNNRGRKSKRQVDKSSSNSTELPLPRTARNRRAGRRNKNISANVESIPVIDLVTAVIPQVEGFINLDSDEEMLSLSKSLSVSEMKKKQLEDLYDEENPEITIRVLFNNKLETHVLREHQKLKKIYDAIAQRENIDEKRLVFDINNEILNRTDTPASIKYEPFHIISAQVADDKVLAILAQTETLSCYREDNKNDQLIKLKIQSDQFKRPLILQLLKTDKFITLYVKCSEELDIPVGNIKLSCNGEVLELEDTPNDMDFEGEEAIDMRIIKK